MWVIAFWAIEVYFEFILHDKDLGFMKGYSFIHFLLMYMIGRTLSVYKERLDHISTIRYMCLYLSSTLAILACYFCVDMQSAYNYCSPFNILAACSLFMVFAKRTFYSRSINWIASSTFAVYIIHTHAPVSGWLKSFDMQMLTNNTYPRYLIIMGGIIVLLFFSCILYDKIAKCVTVPILNLIDNFVTKNGHVLRKTAMRRIEKSCK